MAVEAEAMALQTGNRRAAGANRRTACGNGEMAWQTRQNSRINRGTDGCAQQDFNLSLLSGFIFIRGLSLAEIGRIEEAVAALTHGIDVCEKLGGPSSLGEAL